jgi:excisionase family DNA binding protein
MTKIVQGTFGASSALLTVEQAAEYLNVSCSYLNKLRVRGGGPAFCKLGRGVRYHMSDRQAWVDAHRVGSTSEARAA